jgi:hypothetical protein
MISFGARLSLHESGTVLYHLPVYSKLCLGYHRIVRRFGFAVCIIIIIIVNTGYHCGLLLFKLSF